MRTMLGVKKMDTAGSQKEKLDKIGRLLLETVSVSDKEINEIVANPELFGAVRARLRTAPEKPRSKGILSGWTNLSGWVRYGMAGAAAVLMLLIIASGSLNFFKKQDQLFSVEQASVPENAPFQSFTVNPPGQTPGEISKISKPKPACPKTVKQNVFRKEKPQLPKKRPESARLRPRPEPVREGVFYQLAFGGNFEENGEDLQIVRTELSRLSLMALGVNLPPENDGTKIKTDLLVGADGVARAIRFVK